jgi:glucose-1-phosphate cytidylyltransferase
MFTYGDGVADIDLSALLRFHKLHNKLATVTAVRPPARFGRMAIEKGRVTAFYEKPEEGEGWINGGFFVLNAKVLDYIEGDQTPWEHDPIEHLARDRQMVGYMHRGFWSCMDTLREKNMLEDLWSSGNAPWRIWDNGEPKNQLLRALGKR